MTCLKRRLSPRLQALSWVCLPLASLLLMGFATLYSDQTRWRRTPSYSIQGQVRGIDTQEANNAVRRAFESWSAVQGGGLSFNEVGSGADIPVAFLQSWPQELGQNAAGVTFTYPSNGQITSAEVYINDELFTWSVSPTTPANDTDLEGVTLHEIGHAIGLTHSFYFEATMYWSSVSEETRTLHEDDIRGFRFLYGGVNAGQLCDTCLSNDDCLSGQCFDFNGVTACGGSCGPAPNFLCGDIPEERAGCFELQGGDTSCLPLTLNCNDEAVGVAAEGEYCFGAQHCQGDLLCLVTDSDARCARLGSGELGDECLSSALCESQLCVPLSNDYAICASACDPLRPSCEGECFEVNDPTIDGVCVPAGSVPPGGSCDGVRDRCQAGFECQSGRCARFCEPYGSCPSGLACTPSAGRWRCEPLEGPQEGEACVENRCGGGFFCLQGQQLCVEPCDPNDSGACDGHVCLELNGLGICSPGQGEGGAPCDEDLDCLDLSCVSLPAGEGSACAALCEQGCPAGWECSAALVGARAYCAPIPPTPPVGGSAPEAGSPAPPPLGGQGAAPAGSSPPAPPPGEPPPPPAEGEASAAGDQGSSCQSTQGSAPPLLVLCLLAIYGVLRRRSGLPSPRGAWQ